MVNQTQRQFDYIRLFYFLYFGGIGCFWPYITLFFKRIGFDGVQIGLLTSIGPLMILLTQPLWGIFNDKVKTGHWLLTIACFLSMLVALCFTFPVNFYGFLLLMGIFNFFSYPIVPLADTLSMGFVQKNSLSYGHIRMWGSIGYCISAVLVGELAYQRFFGNYYHWIHPEINMQIVNGLRGIPIIFAAYAIAILGTFFVSFHMPHITRRNTTSFHGSVIGLLKNKRFAFFLISLFLLQTAVTCNTTYFSLYIDYLHGETGLLGWSMTLASASEILVFLFAAHIFRRFNSLHLLMIGGIAGVFRWYLYTLITNPVNSLWLQPTHALTFGCFYLGSVHFVDEESPAEWKTTAQTLFWSVGFGLAAITGNYLGGLIYKYQGILVLFRIGAGLIFIATILFYLIDRYFPAKPMESDIILDAG